MRRACFDLAPGVFGPPCPYWHRLALLLGPVGALYKLEAIAAVCDGQAHEADAKGWPGAAEGWRQAAAGTRDDARRLVEALA